jgi:molybdate transport system substrate-binding protein
MRSSAQMTEARSVAYSRGGQSGVHFVPMLQRIGIADAVNVKATIIPAGFTAEKLVTGGRILQSNN